MKKVMILACLAAMVLGLSACGSITSDPFDWPDTGLAAMLPEPPKTRRNRV